MQPALTCAAHATCMLACAASNSGELEAEDDGDWHSAIRKDNILTNLTNVGGVCVGGGFGTCRRVSSLHGIPRSSAPGGQCVKLMPLFGLVPHAAPQPPATCWTYHLDQTLQCAACSNMPCVYGPSSSFRSDCGADDSQDSHAGGGIRGAVHPGHHGYGAQAG